MWNLEKIEIVLDMATNDNSSIGKQYIKLKKNDGCHNEMKPNGLADWYWDECI